MQYSYNTFSAKYPLAVVDHLLDVLGDDLGIGFDIGCSFKSTLSNSPLLKDRASKQNLLLLLNAFHGYAHNRQCQMSNHPLYVKGCGLEDFEIMEKIFSLCQIVLLRQYGMRLISIIFNISISFFNKTTRTSI